MKYALGILKPDCIEKGMEDFVYSILKLNGFRIITKKRFKFTRRDVEVIYGRCISADFFEELSKFLISGESVVVVVENSGVDDAIKKLNSVVGHINPLFAKPGTVRSFGENIRRNLMHSTANTDTFLKEFHYLFSLEEVDMMGLRL